MPDVLIVDNYDSFTHNLVHLIAELGPTVRVVRNDAATVAELVALEPRAVVLSPGPGRPEDAGVCLALVEALAGQVPVLGVCLGHQVIACVLGARIVHARRPLHGSAAPVFHEGEGTLRDLPRPFLAARYHSLAVDPDGPIRVTAWSEEGDVMGLRDPNQRLEGVQFHPESYLTPDGPTLLAAFLADAGLG